MKNNKFKIKSINKKDRTAVISYKDVDVTVSYGYDEMDFDNHESLTEDEFDELCDFARNNPKTNKAFPPEDEECFESDDEFNNVKTLNKDRIIKHFLEYFEDVMTEIEDRDVDDEVQHIKELRLVVSYLSDVDTLTKRVQELKRNNLINKKSTILDECISSSDCEFYDCDTKEEEDDWFEKFYQSRSK